MSENAVTEILDHISETLVLTDSDDLQGLADLHSSLEEVVAWAESHAESQVLGTAEATASLIEQVILEEVDDAPAALSTVGDQVSSLRSQVCNGNGADVSGDDSVSEETAPSSTATETSSENFESLELPAYVDEEMFTEFLTRQKSVMHEIESLVLELEKGHEQESFDCLRRHLHTLKGESALLGLVEVEELCHTTEDALEDRALSELIDPLLEAKDWLDKAIDSYADGEHPSERPTELLNKFRAADGTPEIEATDADTLLSEEPVTGQEDLGAIVVSLEGQLLSLESEPTDASLPASIVENLDILSGGLKSIGVAKVEGLVADLRVILIQAASGERPLGGPARDAVFDALSVIKDTVSQCGSGEASLSQQLRDDYATAHRALAEASLSDEADLTPTATSPDIAAKPLGEILVEAGSVSQQGLGAALHAQEGPEPSDGSGTGAGAKSEVRSDGEQPKLGELLVRSGETSAKDVAQALRTQRTGQPNSMKIRGSVKVDSERLDGLVELIGELLIAESMVSLSEELKDNVPPAMARHLRQLDKITRELQEVGTSLRMMPLRTTFQKMSRLVRDLSKKSKKKVKFTISGEDTELDKTLVDKIGDPLIHMIRNAMDHGIEDPESRRASGKPEEGRVELRAFHRAGSIYVEIEDDGRGLDAPAILAKAQACGLVKEGETLEDRDIYQLIFHPGLSTATEVTEVSGRGVGMDVVRRNISELRGHIDIQSELGRGTIFSMRLPLTLANIDGMVIRCCGERFVLPTLVVQRLVRPSDEEYTSIFERDEMLNVEGKLVPLYRLASLFNLDPSGEGAADGVIVVLEDGDHHVALAVSEVIGQQQTVIKSLGGNGMCHVSGVSGGAIMPDGRVGLILDVGGLVQIAREKAQELSESRV